MILADGKKPKVSKAEELRIIAQARKLLETRAHESDIRDALVQAFHCSPQHAKRYLSLARAEIFADTMRGASDHLSDAFSFYLGIVRDRKLKIAERIRAQERIDRLLAQEALRKTTDNTTDKNNYDDLKERLELIANHLLPLGLIEAHYPIEEHARVAAEILIQHGLARLPEAPGESPPT